MADNSPSFKKWAGLLWPIGGTFLGLIVIPVAIAQYPDFFNDNPWILPISVAFVLACWVFPLLLHNRVLRLWRWISGSPGGGKALTVVALITLLGGISWGCIGLLRFHQNHLRAVLAVRIPPKSTTPTSPSTDSAALSDGSQPPNNPPVPVPTLPILSRPELRERGLRFSREIVQFLSERQKKEPKGMAHPSPTVVGVPPPNPDNTPLYMRETDAIFARRFESSIADIHDEFSARGLQDEELDEDYKYAGDIFGNVDFIIQRIAEAIRRLALLTPPDDLYRGVSNERLYQMAIAETDNVDKQVRGVLDTLRENPQNKGAAWIFYASFTQCCLNQIEYLRAEIISRIGAASLSSEEMTDFNEDGGIARLHRQNPLSTVQSVMIYLPEFRTLAERLKESKQGQN